MKKVYLSFVLVLLVKLNFAALVVTITNPTNPVDTVCQNTTLNLTCSVTGGTSSISYVWKKNNVQVSTVSTYSYTASNAGKDTCVVIATSGIATSSDTVVFVVYPAPVSPIVTNVSYCQNVAASPLTATGTNLLWYTTATGGTGSSTAPTPSTTTLGSMNYYVSQTISSCESARAVITVTINSYPAITNMTDSVCSGVPFTIKPLNLVNGNIPTGTTYSWLAPTCLCMGMTDGSGASITGTLTNPTNTPQIAVYTVTPVSSAGCYGTAFTVSVTVKPVASITPTIDTVYSGNPFTVTPLGVPSGTTYSWTYPSLTGALTGGAAGNGTDIYGTLTNPTNAAQTAVYSVIPTSGSCAGAPFTVTIIVEPNNTPAINAMTETVCSGYPFTITPVNGVNGIVPVGTTYSWSFPSLPPGGLIGGAAGSGTSITGTLTNVTTTPLTAVYTVTPTSGSITGSTFTVTVTINPVATITTMYDTVCSGTTFTITPVNGVNGIVPPGTTYTWSFPSNPCGCLSGGTAAVGSYTNLTGTLFNTTNSPHTAIYIVTPTTGGCTGDTFLVEVTVNPAYNIVKHDSICMGGSVVVGTHTYTTPGVYIDSLTTSLGCDSNITTILIVVDTFNIQSNQYICIGGSIVVGTHTYTTAGIYIDTLKTTTGCDSIITTLLTVYPPLATPQEIYGLDPVCQGEGSVAYVIAPLNNATSYVWSLPSGVTGSSDSTFISVNFSPFAHTGYIKVKGMNAYCSGGEDSLLVVVQNCLNIIVYPGNNYISIFPSPAVNISTVMYALKTDQQLNISVYDITGRKIEELVNAIQEKGEHRITLDVSKLNSGIYFIKALGEDSFETVKFSVLH